MSKLDSVFSKACNEITQNLLTINEPSKKQVKEEIKEFVQNIHLKEFQEIMKYFQWQKNQNLKNSEKFC